MVLAGTATAWAESHEVSITNGSGATIRAIHIAPPGAGPGANRLRSTLPPHASAEIAYSTGCRATVTLDFDGGQSESFADQDVCAGLRIVVGQGVVATASQGIATAGPSRAKTSKAAPAFKLPHVDVPWTGRSITHRFGGLY